MPASDIKLISDVNAIEGFFDWAGRGILQPTKEQMARYVWRKPEGRAKLVGFAHCVGNGSHASGVH